MALSYGELILLERRVPIRLFLSALLLASVAHADELESTTVSVSVVPRNYVLDGVVEATQQGTIAAQTNGQVVAVHVDVDDVVKQGDVIVELKSTEQRSGVDSARAALAAAKARLKKAQASFDRTREVFAKQAVSRAHMDEVTAELKSARAAVTSAKAAIGRASEQLQYTQVTAPYAGIVTARHIEVGEIAQPGTPLLTGLSLARLRVDVDLPQSIAPAIRKRASAEVRVDGAAVKATHITVFPIADARSGTFTTRVELPENTPGLYPGMHVKVAFETAIRNVITIPNTAIAQRSEVVGVYLLDEDDRPRFQQVRLGRPVGSDATIVLSGLNKQDRIALDPHAATVALKDRRKAVANDE